MTLALSFNWCPTLIVGGAIVGLLIALLLMRREGEDI
jgi:2-polyprenyl-6-methoxyphenol hydroxylase-like FAD-dependent oxidoreductase